jgi:hypothetical protein
MKSDHGSSINRLHTMLKPDYFGRAGRSDEVAYLATRASNRTIKEPVRRQAARME